MGKIPKNIELWKYIWDILMNDKRLRKALTGGASEHEVNACHPRKGKILSMRGTVYIRDQNANTAQGHFISFRRNKNYVNVFDPAPPQGTYGAWANAQVIRELEERTGKKVRINAHHTQHHAEDSFCQTWSLAWLIPSLKEYTRNISTGNVGIQRIYVIVQKIIHSRIFHDFVKKHEMYIQNEIIRGIREFKVKQPAFVTVDGFVRFINKERFRKIFED